ncbi:hypothetical protein NC651_009777 [Populus alba x Populus x berolinensis]|nr:hypothetical protein NC651_009777 [Populus alba x Populus x berolinensis]
MKIKIYGMASCSIAYGFSGQAACEPQKSATFITSKLQEITFWWWSIRRNWQDLK